MKAILTIALILIVGNSIFAQLDASAGKSLRRASSDFAGSQNSKPAGLQETSKTDPIYKPPSYIASEEVRFKGEALMISGTLFLPKKSASQKVPAIVIISDFFSNRDGVKVATGTHYIYRTLAEHFVSQGYAVLRYDRRCTGSSECLANGTMALAAEDGNGAVSFLRDRKEINPDKIWVLGHGDGAYIAANVATSKNTAGLIAISAMGRNASKLLREWAKQRLEDRKASPEEISEYLKKLEKLILRTVGGGATPETLSSILNDDLVEPLIKYPDYAFSWLTDDPLPVYPHVKGDALIIHGGKDRKVPVKESIYIKESFDVNENKNYEVQVLPQMDYYLKVNKGTPSLAVDNDLSRPIDPDLLKMIDDWLTKRNK